MPCLLPTCWIPNHSCRSCPCSAPNCSHRASGNMPARTPGLCRHTRLPAATLVSQPGIATATQSPKDSEMQHVRADDVACLCYCRRSYCAVVVLAGCWLLLSLSSSWSSPWLLLSLLLLLLLVGPASAAAKFRLQSAGRRHPRRRFRRRH